MRSDSERHAAAVRLRGTAPVAALAGPVVLLLAAAVSSAVPCPDGDCTSRSLAVGFLVLAAPATTVLLLLFPSWPLTAALVLGAAASLPLWGSLGRFLADAVVRRPGWEVGTLWRRWWRWYVVAMAAWLVVGAIVAVVRS